MVELRKRKAPAEPAPPPPAKKKNNPVKAIAEKAKNALTGKNESSAASASNGPPTVGSVISLDDFGGEVATNEGEKTTLKKLVDESAGGVVLFTYPKASTPGCKLLLLKTMRLWLSVAHAIAKFADLNAKVPNRRVSFATITRH